MMLETWPGWIFITVFKNKFNSIVLKWVDNSPNLGPVLETFLLNLLVYINMNPPSLSLLKAFHPKSHGQHLSNDCGSLCVARPTTLERVLDWMFDRWCCCNDSSVVPVYHICCNVLQWYEQPQHIPFQNCHSLTIQLSALTTKNQLDS